jgi:hypothetical protein
MNEGQPSTNPQAEEAKFGEMLAQQTEALKGTVPSRQDLEDLQGFASGLTETDNGNFKGPDGRFVSTDDALGLLEAADEKSWTLGHEELVRLEKIASAEHYSDMADLVQRDPATPTFEQFRRSKIDANARLELSQQLREEQKTNAVSKGAQLREKRQKILDDKLSAELILVGQQAYDEAYAMEGEKTEDVPATTTKIYGADKINAHYVGQEKESAAKKTARQASSEAKKERLRQIEENGGPAAINNLKKKEHEDAKKSDFRKRVLGKDDVVVKKPESDGEQNDDPSDIDPGTVYPSDIDPGTVDPADIDPADIDPSQPSPEAQKNIEDKIAILDDARLKYAEMLAAGTRTLTDRNESDRSDARQEWETAFNDLFAAVDAGVPLQIPEGYENMETEELQNAINELQQQRSTAVAVQEHFLLEKKKWEHAGLMGDQDPKNRFLKFWKKGDQDEGKGIFRKLMPKMFVKMATTTAAASVLGTVLNPGGWGVAAATGAVNFGIRSRAKRYDMLARRSGEDSGTAGSQLTEQLAELGHEDIDAATITSIVEDKNNKRRHDNKKRMAGSLALGAATGIAGQKAGEYVWGKASDYFNGPDGSTAADAVPTAGPGPSPNLEPLPSPTPDVDPTSILDSAMNIEAGNGFTHELIDTATAAGYELNPGQSFELYEHLNNMFDTDLIDGIGEYVTGAGETRISAPGSASWRPEVIAEMQKWLADNATKA